MPRALVVDGPLAGEIHDIQGRWYLVHDDREQHRYELTPESLFGRRCWIAWLDGQNDNVARAMLAPSAYALWLDAEDVG